MEIWKDIVGKEGTHQVSNMGGVRSLPRKVQGRYGQRTIPGKVFNCGTGNHGYPQAAVGVGDVRLVHHLVWEAFVGPRTKGLVIRHKNDNKLDARLENLCEGTHSDNQRDAINNGIRKQAISPADIEDIKRQRAAGVSLRKLAAQYGTSHTTIRQFEQRGIYLS